MKDWKIALCAENQLKNVLICRKYKNADFDLIEIFDIDTWKTWKWKHLNIRMLGTRLRLPGAKENWKSNENDTNNITIYNIEQWKT